MQKKWYFYVLERQHFINTNWFCIGIHSMKIEQMLGIPHVKMSGKILLRSGTEISGGTCSLVFRFLTHVYNKIFMKQKMKYEMWHELVKKYSDSAKIVFIQFERNPAFLYEMLGKRWCNILAKYTLKTLKRWCICLNILRYRT